MQCCWNLESVAQYFLGLFDHFDDTSFLSQKNKSQTDPASTPYNSCDMASHGVCSPGWMWVVVDVGPDPLPGAAVDKCCNSDATGQNCASLWKSATTWHIKQLPHFMYSVRHFMIVENSKNWFRGWSDKHTSLNRQQPEAEIPWNIFKRLSYFSSVAIQKAAVALPNRFTRNIWQMQTSTAIGDLHAGTDTQLERRQLLWSEDALGTAQFASGTVEVWGK